MTRRILCLLIAAALTTSGLIDISLGQIPLAYATLPLIVALAFIARCSPKGRPR